MTKTLAEIYFQQGHFQEAYEIFKALSEKDPSTRRYKERLKELSEREIKLSPPLIRSICLRSTEEKIRLLREMVGQHSETEKSLRENSLYEDG